MGKGKKKNQNKNVDVVEEVSKDQPKDDAPQPDTVKESTDQASEPTQQSLPESTEPQKQEKTQQLQSSQPGANEPQKEQKKQEVQAEPTQNIETANEHAQVPSQEQHQQKKVEEVEEQKLESEQKPTEAEPVEQKNKQSTGQPAKEQQKKQESKQEKQAVEQAQTQKVDIKPVEQVHLQNIKTSEIKSQNEHLSSQPTLIKQEISVPKSEPFEVLAVDPLPNAPKEQPIVQKKEEPTNPQPLQIKPETVPEPELSYRHELQDGLHLVAQAMDQLVYQNPLAHQQIAHGNPQFSENFDPVAFHLIERIIQQNQQKTPEKEGSRSNTPPKDSKRSEQILQQIKHSAESIDPDPLQIQTIIQDPQKMMNVLKSMHSDSDEEQKKKERIRRSSQQSGGSKRASILLPPENPTYTNPLPPIPQVENPKANDIISEKAIDQPKKQLNFEEINKQMLKQREIQWKKMQQRQLEPRRPSRDMVSPIPVKQIETSPVLPHAPEKLPYTNNLPIIQELRNKQEKEKLYNQASEIKQKIEENDKLRKQINKDNPSKKIGIAAAISAACLCACVLGKADKKIAAGASIGAFLLGYLVQK